MVDREAELRARIEADPTDAEAMRELAERIARDRRRKPEAAEWWARHADAVPDADRAGALLRLARAQIEMRREAEAIDTLDRCIAAARETEGRDDVERAAATPEDEAPVLTRAWDLKGELLRRSGRLEEAIEALGHAAELDRGAIRPRVALVSCYLALGRERQANAMLAGIRKIAGDNPAVEALVKELMHRQG